VVVVVPEVVLEVVADAVGVFRMARRPDFPTAL
jgi:hypothetical protein